MGKILTKRNLVIPEAYWINAYDGLEDDFWKYSITFRCTNCDEIIHSVPFIEIGEYTDIESINLNSIDKHEYNRRCKKVKSKRQLEPSHFIQECGACNNAYLICYGAIEWQPGRYVIELAGIYEYKR